MSQERQARPTRVLILDEDRVEGGMLAFHLRREGLVVMLMTSAEEAADAIAWAEPDVLLVEVAAQGFDGREFLSQLSHLPVDVFAVADRQLSGEIELDALRLGVIDVMMKPIDPVTLARRLKTRPERKRRGSIAGLPEGGISGDLAVHSVVHLLQMAHRHRLNARLHIEIDGDWAVLLVRHGEVIDAEAPQSTGREAAFQMVRTTAGAFVLFPLPSEAEELSRDDVIRADLATLVADAMGRREPRTVNAARMAEQEAFVLPHVGSPRAPLAKRGGEETLEYAAAELNAGRLNPDSARVRRPGERERQDEIARATVDVAPKPVAGPAAAATEIHGGSRGPTVTGKPAVSPGAGVVGKPVRQPTQPLLTASPGPSAPAVSELAMQAMDARTLQRIEPVRHDEAARAPLTLQRTEGPFVGRSPIESPTVEEGFEEATDQEERRRASNVKRGGAAATGSSGLRRVATGGGIVRGRRHSEQDLEALEVEHDDLGRGRRRRIAPSWSLPTMIMAGAVVVLAIVIVARLASREVPEPVNIDADPGLKLGQALIDLDEGRRDQARVALATLAIDQPGRAAPSEVLATLAKVHYQDRSMVEAQALFERLVERNPRDADALAWLGLVQAERNELTKAQVTFEKALQGASGALAERLQWLVPKKPPTEGAAVPTEVVPSAPVGTATPAAGTPAPGQ